MAYVPPKREENAILPPSKDDSDDETDSEDDAEALLREKQAEKIPDAVDHFLGELLKALQHHNVPEIHKLYEETFNQLTDKHYRQPPKRWPSPEAVEAQVSSEPLFLILYKELYCRHLFSMHGITVTCRDYEMSWDNYCRFLDLIVQELEDGDEPSVALPAQWIWDILDEFVYHFLEFCKFRNRVLCTTTAPAAASGKSHHKFEENRLKDLNFLKGHRDIYETTKVISYLRKIIDASLIEEFLKDPANANGRQGAFTNEVIRLIGYFGLQQVLRMHMVLSDYHLALKSIQHLDFTVEVPMFYKIPACHCNLYYYMGFAYLMMRRYSDAIRTFSEILVFLQKTSGVNHLSYQYTAMQKKIEQMYYLLIICEALCPIQLDESLEKHIRSTDKYNEKTMRLSRGDDLCFEECFSFACPKFISASPPDFDALEKVRPNESHERQVKLFLQEVKQQQALPKIGSYMKLYTAIKTSKLAQLCEMDEEGLRDQLMCVIHKTRQMVRQGEGAPLDGKIALCSEVEFYLDGDMVHINVQKTERPHTEVFLEHIGKFQEILRKCEKR